MGGIHVGKGVFIDPHADRWFASTHPALTLRPANGNPSVPERHIVSRASRLAICITGLQRTYPEIGRNIERVLLHRTDRPYLFGVRPAGMWPDVKLRFDVVEDQREPLVRFEEIPFKFFPMRSGAGFVRELSDLAHCEEMIARYEQQVDRSFDLVMRVRLDLFWETMFKLPRTIGGKEVVVPHMSHCSGSNDKFAIGGRAGMHAYLTRVRWLRRNFSRSVNSETYLSITSRVSRYRIQHRDDWMFCKFGKNRTHWKRITPDDPNSNSNSAWPECTHRIRQALPCKSMVCKFCAGGCRCFNQKNHCPKKAEKAQLCYTTNVTVRAALRDPQMFLDSS